MQLWLSARSWSRHFLKFPRLGLAISRTNCIRQLRVNGGLGWGPEEVCQEMQLPQDFSTLPVPSRPLAFPHATSFCQTQKFFPRSQKLKICLKNVINLKSCVTQQILNLFPKLTPAATSTLPYHLLLFGSTSLETSVFIKNLIYTSLDTSSLAECSKG